MLKKLPINSLIILICSVLLSACQSTMMTPPTANLENIQKGREVQNASVAVGAFEADKKVNDKKISSRALTLQSPTNQSFAQYLRETLSLNLEAAGLLDKNSDKVITGLLLKSELNSPIGIGTGYISALITVKEKDQVLYQKEVNVDAQWDSHFMGAIAIPTAIGEYEALYRKLVGQLLSDSEFQKAIQDTK